MAAHLAKLRQRCRGAGIPAIYVYDNFGQWRSDAKTLIARCLDSSCAGKPFVEQLKPDDEDCPVLKPMHPVFSGNLLRQIAASSAQRTTRKCGIQLVRALGLFGGAPQARARPGDHPHF